MKKLLIVIIIIRMLVLGLPATTATPVAAATAVDCTTNHCAFLPLIFHNSNSLPGLNMKACLVTDVGGVNDKSFNEMAWQGFTRAYNELGVATAYLESTSQASYTTNINTFLQQKCNLITTVGFLMGDVTKTTAMANLNQKFAIVDFTYDPVLSNVRGLAFHMDQPSFLAGYLAAGMAKNGKVATFGGMKIPPVTNFMDGFYLGVQYYNAQNSTSVSVLGWNPSTQDGIFTNDFANPTLGKTITETFLASGADIIFPVAGATSLGAAEAVKLNSQAWVIGVDTDWTITYPTYASIVLTSVVKRSDVATFNTISDLVYNHFTGGSYYGSLANGAADLSTVASAIPSSLITQLNQVRSGIIAGTIQTSP